MVLGRKGRLEKVCLLCQQEIDRLGIELNRQEMVVVRQAQVILSTMANVYLSPLLNRERFDVVVVEEAAMAVLPTLFYCAALAQTKIIMVGDKRQLPPIIQSNSEYVNQAMGRNIFEATEGTASNMVVMLEVQYRMHPVIGEMVSQLFYQGRLKHGENAKERRTISDRRPFPGEPLVLIDTDKQTVCQTDENSLSRFNEQNARLCVNLAVEATADGIQSVAIITPYVSQCRRIRQLLSSYRIPVEQVQCRTVHRFQGNERDLVIFDTVDTAPMSPGILLAGDSPRSNAPNLLNVSLSRARGKLIIVAAYFQANAAGRIIDQVLNLAVKTGRRMPMLVANG